MQIPIILGRETLRSTLEDNLNAFIQVRRDNQSKINQRLDSVEASIKNVEAQGEQLAEHLQKHDKE